MRRIGLAVVLALGLTLAPLAAEGQQTRKMPIVGVLGGTIQSGDPRGDAVLTGLRDFGYENGKNIVIEWRTSGEKSERLPDLAAELVRLKADVIVASDNPAILAAQKATKTVPIPIVMILAVDPVASGFVVSLARPGGNITGLTPQSSELQAKALQILKEALPTISRIAILWNHSEPDRRPHASEADAAARALGLKPQLLGVGSLGEIESVFATMDRDRPDALLIHGSRVTFTHRARIADLAKRRRLPTIVSSADWVEAGALMSYGPNYVGLYRRAGYYVDKVLRGAKPANLPVEQPTKFELVINLRTAKALGLTIPPSVLLRADHVIE